MDGNAGIGLKLLAIERRKHSHVLLRAATHCAADDGVVLVDHLHEVARVHVHALNS